MAGNKHNFLISGIRLSQWSTGNCRPIPCTMPRGQLYVLKPCQSRGTFLYFLQQGVPEGWLLCKQL